MKREHAFTLNYAEDQPHVHISSCLGRIWNDPKSTGACSYKSYELLEGRKQNSNVSYLDENIIRT
jgi:hypothetical protein